MLSNVNYLDTDHLVVYGFLAITLFVGLYVGRRVKDMNDYALAGRSYDMTSLVLTFLATGVGAASTVGLASNVFEDGIIMIIASAGAIIALLLVALFIIPRTIDPQGSISMAELMGKFYGSKVRITTGILGSIYCIGIVAAQNLALGFVFEQLLGVARPWGIVIGGSIMVLYASLGGVRSVTITDIIHFSFMIVFIPLISSMATNKAGGVVEIFNSLPPAKLTVWGHSQFDYYLVLFFLCMIPSVSLSPPQVQRMLMTDKKKHIKHMLLINAGAQVPFTLIIMLIGLSALILYPSIDPQEVFAHTINSVVPTTFKGLAIAGIIAVIMSTGDSCLNTGGILVVHDVVRPLADQRQVLFDELKWVKYVTALIGAAAILIAAEATNIIQVLFYPLGLFASLVIIPFVAGWIGMKVSAKSFFTAAFAAFITYVAGSILLDAGISKLAVLLSIIVNGITFFAVHLREHQGIAFVESVQAEEATLSNKFTWIALKRRLLRYIPTLKNIVKYSQDRVSRYGANHATFATFLCLNYIFPYFMWTGGEVYHYNVLTTTRVLGATLCVPLLLKNYWPAKALRYFPIYWHISVMYVLPFSTTLFFLIMGGTTEWLINVALAIMLLIAVVDWLTFIIMAVLGTGLGIAFYHLLFFVLDDLTPFSPDLLTMHQLIYACLFSTFIGLLFFRRREKEIDKRLETLELFGKAVAHEVRNIVGLSKSYASSIRFFTQQMRVEKIKPPEDNRELLLIELDKKAYTSLNEVIEGLARDSERGMQTINRILANMRKNVHSGDFTTLSMRECITNSLALYGLTTYQKEKVMIDVEEDFEFYGSEYYMQHVIFNLLKNAYKYSREDCVVDIWLENNRLHFKDNGPGIAREALPYIFDHFFTTDKSGIGIGLAFCRLVMEEFEGTIICKSKQGKGSFTEFILAFPPVKRNS